ncbi:MAG: fused MFS/spermidine synthase [Elusimicrobia bacterium]|nr:fused MFS/spermidine synthase [Elusimicrobiota bacterium]
MKHGRAPLAQVMGLMFLSGAAALSYEVIWMRMLSRAFGVTVHAVAALVALYMGGLALGAWAGPRLRWRGDWLRLYAWLEAAAGLAALAGTWWMLRLPEAAAAWSASRPLPALPRLLLAAPALLPPTILLGATLPVLTRHSGSPGRLYAANTLGAMTGLALVSFWAIGSRGETFSVALAAALNLAAAALAAALSRGGGGAAAAAAADGAARPWRPAWAFALFAVSGFCALGYEIIWSRQLILLLGNSTYAFALLLIVYLGGIGLGSLVRIDRRQSPEAAFATLLAALGCAAVVSVAAYRFMGTGLDAPEFLYSPLRRFGDLPLLLLEAVVVILPVSLMLGLLFPAAVRLCSESGDEAPAVGRLYAVNTLGGIAGSLWAGFIGVRWLGAHRSFLALAGLQLAAGLAAACAAGRRGQRRAWQAPAAFAAASLLLLPYVWRDPTLSIMGNRLRHGGPFSVLFHDESPAATITGVDGASGRNLYITGIETSGKGWAGDWMAVLPGLLVESPRSSLVICLGVGNTLRAAAALFREVDGVELIADVVRRIPVFHPSGDAPKGSVQPRVFIEDGRNYLLRTRRRYDVIIVDAAPPLYSAGTVNLYTREFMELALSRLEEGGLFTLWLPVESFESDYWRIMRGMADVFPHVAVWAAPNWKGFLVLGARQPLAWPPGVIARRIRQRAKDWGWLAMGERNVRAGFILTEDQLRAYLRRFAPVTDDRPSVEFPLPRFWRGEPLWDWPTFLWKARPSRPGTSVPGRSRARGPSAGAQRPAGLGP